MRGNRVQPLGWLPAAGSIPACAGEPWPLHQGLSRPAVYPRVCGGTPSPPAGPVGPAGLSPRVRGNPCRITSRAANERSIPACAGEPAQRAPQPLTCSVYPRVCGGTSPTSSPITWCTGLSPRVRGNQRLAEPGLGRLGSIPACAGEPIAGILGFGQLRVYPRVCGGTILSAQYIREADGLSPRVRGNQTAPGRASRPGPVYPRVCGGTTTGQYVGVVGDGLSPRVRGNHRVRGKRPLQLRSIPACAGEPTQSWSRLRGLRVYPRVCGGTRDACSKSEGTCGLSPRVRGNLVSVVIATPYIRSIPACAGEPPRLAPPYPPTTVYPRVCGGTRCASAVG